MGDGSKKYLCHVVYGYPPKFMTIKVPWSTTQPPGPYQVLVDEIERLRAENERYYLLFTKLQDIAGDQRFSDEFVGSSTRRRLKKFAATKEDDRAV